MREIGREAIPGTRGARVSRSRCNRGRKADARRELQCRRRSDSRDPCPPCRACPSRRRSSISCRRHRRWRPDTGSRIPGKLARNNPPNPPIFPSTCGPCVCLTNAPMPRFSLFARSTSTPARAYAFLTTLGCRTTAPVANRFPPNPAGCF